MSGDVVARATAALDATQCTGEMQDFFQVGLVRELVAELERARRACKTLSETVEKQCRMALDASGLHHLIDEDGDGDWGLVWERLAEHKAEVEKLRGAMETIRGHCTDLGRPLHHTIGDILAVTDGIEGS